ncbi:13170_t:CDS:2, partial [Acaulospora colombiana]
NDEETQQKLHKCQARSPTTIKPTTTKSHSWHDNDSTPFIKMEPYGDYNDNNWQEFRRRMDHQDESHSAVGQPFYASQPMTIYPIDYATQAGSNNAPDGIPVPRLLFARQVSTPPLELTNARETLQHQHQHQPSSRPTSQSYGTSPVYSIFGNVPSSYNSDNSDMEWSQDNNAGSGQGPDASAFSSVTARRAHVVEWISKTNLTPVQVQIAQSIISSKWWEKEDPEPELRPDDPLITSKLINVVGGSRFKAFLDEDNGDGEAILLGLHIPLLDKGVKDLSVMGYHSPQNTSNDEETQQKLHK